MLLLILSLIISSAFGVILSINPINSILFLILSFVSTSFLFLLINLEFFGLIFLIIYVGAISVLFLFIIMMININKLEKEHTSYLVLSTIIIFFIFILFMLMLFDANVFNNKYIFLENYYFFFINNNLDSLLRINLITNVAIILYNIKMLLIIIVGFLLFIIMVYSIYLTNYKKGLNKKYQYDQISRKDNLLFIYIY